MVGLPYLPRMLTRTLFLLLMLALIGCPPSRPAPAVATMPQIPAATLGPDDLVAITVYLEESLSGEYTVDDQGSLDLPLLGSLSVRGLTAGELADALETRLADGYLRDPDVRVQVVEFNSRKVSVLGMVREPGRYPFRDGMTLVQAIAEAGGTTDSALLSSMRIARTDPKTQEQTLYEAPFRDITLGKYPDFYLMPGDVVVVQESVVK
jgi:protein involved in polysaccharide export with SLBB domain